MSQGCGVCESFLHRGFRVCEYLVDFELYRLRQWLGFVFRHSLLLLDSQDFQVGRSTVGFEPVSSVFDCGNMRAPLCLPKTSSRKINGLPGG